MKSKLKLALGFHCHAPVEVWKNNGEINSINNHLKLIDLLENFQNLKSTIHLSGNLITYLDKNFSTFSSKLRNLLDKNQLELLGGGIYEPIFSCIPKEDRHTQLTLMSRLLNHIYGYTPHGAWIPDFSWEPSVALELAKSRIYYTCLSEDYFIYSGLDKNEINGYYVTEEEGRKVAIFPIAYDVNDLINKHSPEDCISLLLDSNKTVSQAEEPLVVAFYDGLIDDKDKLLWFENLFKKLTSGTSGIDTVLFNDYFMSNKPKGRIYLPVAQDLKSQAKYSGWKNFLIKYPEANLLHKKMLRVSKKINSAKEGKSRFKVIKEMISQAQDLLLKGQCNNFYWDNVWGGIYLPEGRHSTYSNLIKAEKLIDQASRQGSKFIQASEIDYDCDGNDEIIIETETQNIYISPALGATILEYDYKPKNLNLTNVVSRRYEPYHNSNNSQKVHENGNLIYDKYPKLNLLDHFLDSSLTLENCKSSNLPHLTNEVILPYHMEKIKAKEETCKITFNFNAMLSRLERKPEIELKKQINTKAGDSSIIVDYTFTNKTNEKCNFIFGTEFNLSPSKGYDTNCYFYLDGDPKNKTSNPDLRLSEMLTKLNQVSIRNKSQGIDLSLWWSIAGDVFRFPVETLSYYLHKLETVYQGVTVLPIWSITLEPSIPLELILKLEIRPISEEI